jgi:acyl carrier protein
LPTIGRPIANTEIYILDAELREVPAGAPGELFIGGAGLAMGYLNRPELTSEKFIQNPFDRSGVSRLYRTGDLACFLEDGEIAYLGRIDEQVKILGHRIEPEEIVSVLNRHSTIQTSVVVAREDVGAEKQLVAYLVPNPASPPVLNDIRDFLRNELPEYMVPSAFVQLNELPLTKNGKVDRDALPPPAQENVLSSNESIAPRTPLEHRVAAMISALLGISEVGITDNFFMLGGHSLLGTQLISHIRGAFGVEIALRTLFDGPTVAQLASEIEQCLMARVEEMSEDQVLALLA